jgi:hypothetical protein
MPPSGGVSDEIVGPTGPNAPRDCYPPLPIELRWTTLAAAGDDGSVRILFARSDLRNRKVERQMRAALINGRNNRWARWSILTMRDRSVTQCHNFPAP